MEGSKCTPPRAAHARRRTSSMMRTGSGVERPERDTLGSDRILNSPSAAASRSTTSESVAMKSTYYNYLL